MKYSEWLETKGFLPRPFDAYFRDPLANVLDADAEILAAVVDQRENPEGFHWKRNFMLLTADQLIVGHSGNRLPTGERPEGLELVLTVVPVRSVSSVTINLAQRGYYTTEKCIVEFNDGRPAMTLPLEGADHYREKDFMNLARALLRLLK